MVRSKTTTSAPPERRAGVRGCREELDRDEYAALSRDHIIPALTDQEARR